MSGVNAINYILDHIVKESKTILKDKIVDRQKVPPFVNTRVECISVESVIHEGNQHQPVKKYSCFSLQKDNQPKNIKRDGLGPNRLKIDKQKVVKSNIKSPEKSNYKHRSFSYSGLKGGKLKNEGFSTARAEQRKQEKQNGLVKLEDNNTNRKVIERVRLRESMEDDQLRAQKQKVLLKEYEQKKANEIFQKERTERYSAKQRLLNEHKKKGQEHSFFFDDEGEAILFKQARKHLTPNYVQSARFKIDDEADVDFEIVNAPVKKPYLSRKHFQSAKSMNEYKIPNENHQHQRIRSAKGEAFASSVLKTVNLSRISMNQSLRQLQVEQFMKRNDLFNNNHTRQTTSIPYLQTKPGTVYTQLSTNQMVSNDANDKRTQSKKSSNENSRVYSRKKSHFQPLPEQEYRPAYKTQRKFDQAEWNIQDNSKQVQPRSIKTADQYMRRLDESTGRPYTSSVSKGKITTMNEELVLALIE